MASLAWVVAVSRGELSELLPRELKEHLAAILERPLSALTRGYLAYLTVSCTWNWILKPCRRKLEASKTQRQLPNPAPSLFWGHFQDIFVHNRCRIYERMWESFGARKTVQFATPLFDSTPIFINTIDARNVKHILQDNFDNYIKTDENRVLQSKSFAPGTKTFLRDGIFTIDHGVHAIDGGKGWKMQRKIAAQIFTKNNFNTHMSDCFFRQAQSACDWVEHQGTRSLDFQDLFRRFTMESIGNIFFGTDFGLFKEHCSAASFGTCFDEVSAKNANLRGSRSAMYALSDLCPKPFDRILSAWYWQGKEQKEFVAKCEEMRSYCRDIVHAARRDPKLSERRDLLALFMNSKQDDAAPLTDELLVDLVVSFALAGRDTTASLLTWSVCLLGQYPHVQEKLRAEIMDLGSERPSYKTVEKMPYLRGLLWEVLRMRPVVPLDAKVAAKADVLPDGTYVPKNARVFFFPWGVGLDKDRWGEDLHELRPERWIGKPLPSSFDFPVFQAGPRICLGMNMALFEAGIMLVTLLQRFQLSLADPKQKVRHDMTAVMGIEGGILLQAKSLELPVAKCGGA